MRKFFILLLAISLLSVGLSAQTFRVVATEWPPYTTMQGQQPAGLAIEILDAVLKSMGITPVFEFVPWERAERMVREGSAEAIVSLSFNESRTAFLYYPQTPLHASRYVFFANRSRTGLSYTNYTELAAYTFGLTRGYSYTADFLSFVNDRAKSQSVDDDATGFRMLNANRIDLMPCDQANGIALLRSLGLYNNIVMVPGPPLTSRNYFVGFSKTSAWLNISTLAGRFDTALLAFQQTPAYRAIIDKYEK
ncbi:MAG: hypothetical protein A2087_06280 [Spirochaetes bacterium GWD1_61_31]|nr:MAG: hypothetical protein A2Y37_01085 [Spirochaetes bacterium GWB1_60_80]OHD35210.1 MAG: hypothetical protein A2004_11240 [Spirochaetes bacterium GWC1_61_12]OHD41794.1 MAG: hypothetical protein A2087_06280 [Spirochaetes bacterium GWD1_61_31]OHD42598.1 MAG: hypothetical protein A2Y35_07805 [Spirochaetes bacterium GWE1_60_18]OHD59830.1 MAG: hypothetical protein A2Y32_01565 [Spirochaetes bacterium GWF1_60_12]HAP44151.1 hypothetical protein [Spirochaetaceae bacterium]